MKQFIACCCVVLMVGCASQDSEPENNAEAQTTPVEVEAVVEAPPAPEAQTPEPHAAAANPTVRMTTSMGVIVIELNAEKAPISVENFLGYAQDGYYNGTIFHRVIPNFMIQGGGFTPQMQQKPTRSPIKNEAANGLKNLRGTVAMARTNVPDSATSQFFINHRDNAFLDYRGPQPQTIGYAVFGKVVSGMDVVDKIAAVATTQVGPHGDVPATPVVIESVDIVKP